MMDARMKPIYQFPKRLLDYALGCRPERMGEGSHREGAVGELQHTKESLVGEHRQRKYSRFIGT
jgi:hypothetical protein